MKILVLGSGGREHAIVHALKSSPVVEKLHVAPGNDGMKTSAEVHPIALNDLAGLQALYQKNKYDLVVVGPDQALADGLSDFFRNLGAVVFGPSQEASRLEWSKAYAKDFMSDAGIPTARFERVSSFDDVMAAQKKFKAPWVLKADGLALGKGVFICATDEELRAAATEIFVDKKFGEAGRLGIVEEFKPGWEISLHVVTDGENYQIFPFAQDHKRLLEGNKGPNTGGMGTVAPIPVDAALVSKIENLVVKPAIAEIKKRKLLYRGILFVGLMICENEPLVLEFNARFGDPETQVFMPLLDGDWAEALLSVASGKCLPMKWKALSAVCVVLAAPGYPDSPKKGVGIEGDLSGRADQYFLHAGTKNVAGSFVTNGGRVLNAIGIGSTLSEARAKAYAQADKVHGLVLRKDLGSQFIK